MNPGLCAQLACLWEATARKAGNVHCQRDLPGLTYLDFLHSAAAIGLVLRGAAERPVGETILEAIKATRRVVTTNTNLGIVLLLAPLAAVPRPEPLAAGLTRLLGELSLADARHVFAAIRLACPGGLGEVSQEDVAAEPTLPLRQVMALAADRDLVARQYADGFRGVLDFGISKLRDNLAHEHGLEEVIILTHLDFLANYPDSLIARKRGLAEANEASRRAAEVAVALRGQSETARGACLLRELDDWLCAGRNPGTSADLVTACLFAALREGIIELPLNIPWSRGWHHG
jgi:triphosphoribosyl-dephospho-CoA synthase